MSISGEGLVAAVRGVARSLDSGAISNPGKIPPRSSSIFGTKLDANVVDYSDPEFAGRGPAAAYGVITMQSLETLLSNRASQTCKQRFGAGWA